MDDDNGNGGGFAATGATGALGNPHITTELCEAYRGHLETKIDTMESKILSSIKLTGAIIAIIVTVVQLGLHFLGG